MAYTRTTAHSGVSVTVKQGSDGKWHFILREHFYGATVDSKTGDQSGQLEIANKEEASSPLPTVKKQSTAIKPPVKKKSSRYVIPFDKSRYTIQIASKKNLNDAEKVAVNLIESGYDAYIQKAYFRDTDEVWFRVRVGSYDNRDTALSVGKVIADAMTTEVWIDFVRFEE